MTTRIAAFILCYNESEILPHTIQHYQTFCKDIYILNNGSTDDTKKIAENLGCIVIDYKSEGINELQYLNIKQNCYKFYRNLYDYIIVCDADEFLYHKNILKYLESNIGVDCFRSVGYEMLFDDFDYRKNSYKDVNFASRSLSHDKSIIFKSTIDIKYSIGCHTTNNICFNSELQLRHMKYINVDYVLSRYKHFSERMSEVNKINNWGFHYNWEKEKIINYYNNLLNNKIKLEW